MIFCYVDLPQVLQQYVEEKRLACRAKPSQLSIPDSNLSRIRTGERQGKGDVGDAIR
jgi:hypothetical protein